MAADLASVSSSARSERGNISVEVMLEESQYYIEWIAAELETEIAAELVDIQRMIVLWREAWHESQHNRTQRTLLSVQTKKWSDQILNYSGIMEKT